MENQAITLKMRFKDDQIYCVFNNEVETRYSQNFYDDGEGADFKNILDRLKQNSQKYSDGTYIIKITSNDYNKLSIEHKKYEIYHQNAKANLNLMMFGKQ